MMDKQKMIALSLAEIAECVRDIAFCQLQPESEHRNLKLGSCIVGMERALTRLQVEVLDQKDYMSNGDLRDKLNVAMLRIKELEGQLK